MGPRLLPNSYYYLAHPYNSMKKIRKWELKIEKKHGVALVNPFFEGQYPEKKEIEKLYASGKTELTKEECAWIVINDVNLIRDSIGIIAIVDGALSYGTIMEIVYAYKNDKRIFLICTNGQHGHVWLKHHATKIFTSFDQFEEYIENGGL